MASAEPTPDKGASIRAQGHDGRLSAKAAVGNTPPIALASHFVMEFMDNGGLVDVDRVATAFRMTKGQLAETAGLATATISKTDRKASPRTQARVTEMLEIISRVRAWAGGEAQAMAWYRSQPIPALDSRTPEALVKAGQAGAVRDYLDHMALGGFA
ncbi:antitoxin Xre/MbcA/ParS toxin-binding domain-containing protein [Sphingomonas sp. RT2P30]|uniref:antitoxin Xre/MbcA/ParS toxin-binding domain-containing protein n=1 Tax=Parasphingomonas halimpatiens TaxID=3096162 RepID=UPI002FC86B68